MRIQIILFIFVYFIIFGVSRLWEPKICSAQVGYASNVKIWICVAKATGYGFWTEYMDEESKILHFYTKFMTDYNLNGCNILIDLPISNFKFEHDNQTIGFLYTLQDIDYTHPPKIFTPIMNTTQIVVGGFRFCPPKGNFTADIIVNL